MLFRSNDTATTEIYTLSLHDALPIFDAARGRLARLHVVYTFEIYAQWRHRFAPGVVHNVEHAFALELPARPSVSVAAAEHLGYQWLPWREAAAKCFSWSNRDAIVMLGER